jgi:integrase
MARKVKNKNLDSREARRKLKVRDHCYWHAIERRVHLGYRRLAGNGSWWLRRYLDDGRYAVESLGAFADDLSDADGRIVLDFWGAVARARERLPVGELTVKAACESYLEWLASNRKSAVDTAYRVKAFILPQLGSVLVDRLTTDQLRRWHVGLSKEPPRARTRKGAKQQYLPQDVTEDGQRRRQASANRMLAILRAALNHAFRDGAVASDAAWRKAKGFRDVDAARVRYLTIKECKRLIAACDPDFRKLVQAALFTGCRYSELARLRVSDFNPHSGTLAIYQSKSGKPRHCVLTAEGVAWFAKIVGWGTGTFVPVDKKESVGWGVGAHAPTDKEKSAALMLGKVWGLSNQKRPMRLACLRAGIKPIGFHGLRHTYASLSSMNGMPLLVVAKNLGHSDTRMVEKHYGHLSKSFIADAVREFAPKFDL